MEVTWVKEGEARTDIISNQSLSVGQLVYLAGFFDGEGSVGLYYQKAEKAWVPKLSITQNTSKHVVRLFRLWADVFGGRVCVSSRKQISYVYLGRRASLMAFIQYVGPYCVGKKQQLIVLENWLMTREYSYRTAQILKALKRNEHG